MAVSFTCDGCRQPVDRPKQIGHVLRREYCEQCAATAEKFLNDEESLRKALHEKFVDDRAALIARYAVDGFKLPDVPG